jgi:hypothetical protein
MHRAQSFSVAMSGELRTGSALAFGRVRSEALPIAEALTMRQGVALGLGVTLWRSIVND